MTSEFRAVTILYLLTYKHKYIIRIYVSDLDIRFHTFSPTDSLVISKPNVKYTFYSVAILLFYSLQKITGGTR
jgi:hypothetical protein